MTVLETIQRSTEFLTRKGVDTPRLQAELLLAHLLQLPRMQLYLSFERILTPLQVSSFRELIKRRGKREPLQYIVGSTSFCGLEIAVSASALIPRPETELLAEEGWKFLNLISSHGDQSLSALDFGTGTGCLAISIALHCPTTQVEALEISPAAMALAKANTTRHGVESRIQFRQGDGLGILPANSRFDLILGNPPYIPSGEIDNLQPEVRDFEPRQALDGGLDGLDFYRGLAAEAWSFLNPHGAIMLEFGDGQAEPLRKLFTDQNWVVERMVSDYTQRARILIARKAAQPGI